MLKLEELIFQAPSIIDPQLVQLRSRVENGYMPYVIVTKPVAEEHIKKFIRYIRDNKVNVSFEIGSYLGEPIETSIMLLNHVDEIRRQLPKQISSGIKAKVVPAITYPGSEILRPGVDCGQYREVHRKTREEMKKLYDEAQGLGVTLEIENRARPLFTEKGFNIDCLDQKVIDPTPRCEGILSALPRFEANVFGDAREIVNFLKDFKDTRLQLDIEHICQNAQYGNIFTFANRKNRVLRVGDLNKEQKEILITYGINFDDNKKTL